MTAMSFPSGSQRRLAVRIGIVAFVALLAIGVLIQWNFVTALVNGDIHWCTTSSDEYVPGEGYDPNMMSC